jgi:hypothetical protein
MKSKISKTKHSLGALRKATNKTKPKSPDLIGSLHFQRHTFEDIAQKFHGSDGDEIICPIAAWGYSDNGELYLTVQLSAPYEATKKPRVNILAAIFAKDDEEQ